MVLFCQPGSPEAPPRDAFEVFSSIARLPSPPWCCRNGGRQCRRRQRSVDLPTGAADRPPSWFWCISTMEPIPFCRGWRYRSISPEVFQRQTPAMWICIGRMVSLLKSQWPQKFCACLLPCLRTMNDKEHVEYSAFSAGRKKVGARYGVSFHGELWGLTSEVES